MDPCPFVRILIGNLALKFPSASRSAVSNSNSCFCKIKLKNFPTQLSMIPLLHQQQQQQSQNPENSYLSNSLAACFNLDKIQIDRITESKKPTSLSIEIYSGGNGKGMLCGYREGKFLGKVNVPIDLKKAKSRPCVMQNGWIGIGGNRKGSPMVEFNLCVRADFRVERKKMNEVLISKNTPRHVSILDGVKKKSLFC